MTTPHIRRGTAQRLGLRKPPRQTNDGWPTINWHAALKYFEQLCADTHATHPGAFRQEREGQWRIDDYRWPDGTYRTETP